MKSLFTRMIFTYFIVHSAVIAHQGLAPDDVRLLSRTAEYTFHQICDSYQNPVPSIMFDEFVSTPICILSTALCKRHL